MFDSDKKQMGHDKEGRGRRGKIQVIHQTNLPDNDTKSSLLRAKEVQ